MLKTVSAITNAIGALNYKGTWNASTNNPALASSVGTKGDYYVVSVAGTTTLDGISNWGVGDWATFNGSVWQRVEGGADVNGVNVTFTGTATGPTFDTGVSTAKATLSGTTLAAGGSNTDVDLNVNAKGAGVVKVGSNVNIENAAPKETLSNGSNVSTSTNTVYSTLAFRSLRGPGAGIFAFDDAWIQTQRANIEYGGDGFTHDSKLVFFTNGSNRDGNPYEVFSAGFYGLTCLRTYNATVGATNRDLYVDNTGLIGYVTSTRESKANIASLDDVSWLLRLDPVAFNRRKKVPVVEDGQIVGHKYTEETYDELEFGLIADDAELVKQDLCFYDTDEKGNQKLSGVKYGQLTTPLLKLVQQQQKMIDALNERITKLEQGV